MIDFLVTKLHDARFMTMLLAAIAASATAYTLIMPRFAGADAVSEERHQEAAALDQTGFPRRAGPAADLHRIRHVDRDRVPQGQRRDRLAIGRPCRGILVDHRRAVVLAGSQGGLRKS